MNFEMLKFTLFLNGLTLLKIPLIAFCLPRVEVLSDEKCIVKIPLGYRTRNHLNSMYFGALAIGAELSVALKAVQEIQKSGHKIDFIFKDFNVRFLKKADGDVLFHCDEVAGVKALIEQAINSTERLEGTYKGYATVPSKHAEPIVEYAVTLSVRKRS